MVEGMKLPYKNYTACKSVKWLMRYKPRKSVTTGLRPAGRPLISVILRKALLARCALSLVMIIFSCSVTKEECEYNIAIMSNTQMVSPYFLKHSMSIPSTETLSLLTVSFALNPYLTTFLLLSNQLLFPFILFWSESFRPEIIAQLGGVALVGLQTPFSGTAVCCSSASQRIP